ncbi:MAG: PIN domain-containing protein [Pseudonocardiaceae bacterium]
MNGILDTSVFIAREDQRPLNEEQLPSNAAISVVTIAELKLGVARAKTPEAAAAREITLNEALGIARVPINTEIALTFADLAATLSPGRTRTNVQDLWIAATAHAFNVPVYTAQCSGRCQEPPSADVRPNFEPPFMQLEGEFGRVRKTEQSLHW